MRFIAPLLALCLLPTFPDIGASVIVFDDFGPSGTNSALSGRTPVTSPGNDWIGYSSGTSFGWQVSDGEAQYGSSSVQNGMAGILLSANYFADNPNVYSLKSTMSMTDIDATTWYGVGFSESIGTVPDRGFYIAGPTEGRPWIFARNNGELNVRAGGATGSTIYSQTGKDFSSFEMELVLDTSVANWTVDAFFNGVQLDLNGGSIGMTYTYSTNPSSLGAIGFSSSANAQGTIQSITLETIPEPQTYAIILGAVCLVGLIARRRR
ncbi:PEP-CTERM sorting domain-containing protein [Cerasicoccus arenae]|uniref:Ice-binding protein C-terminal domain-containing protein n=1 Tax=Cerasicoccus arenae TaxID=424488 RepID=A0A8J3GF06_9BACT|nr:PEP-CTERM sorting domain-containing protein [Cerasicoccus arenae]MBK1857411.1 hypothetical protein [Cerasicoccus arenae]GHC07883.1 hypothetical protein GCM10007047_26370 [Cerasicoccus arenae]